MKTGPDHSTEEHFTEKRRALVLEFCDLPGKGSPVTFQRHLAAELLAAETNVTGASPQELSQHKRLVRIIGDSLAFSLLHKHTIRTLSRHPGLPPSMKGQQEDFEHVIAIAEMLAVSGYVPLLCDVTNLLKVGDIIAVAEEHVLVLECKRSPLPSRLPGTGRLARQRLRGTQAAEYLQRSRITEADGVRAALPFNLPEPRWRILTDLASKVSLTSASSAVAILDDGDAAALVTIGDSFEALEPFFDELNRTVAAKVSVIGTQLDVISNPRWNCPSPLTFPVSPLLRFALLEGNALLLRLIDFDRFVGSRTTKSGRKVELRATWSASKAKLSMAADDQCHDLGPWFLDSVMHTLTTVAEMKEALLSCADAMVAPAQETVDNPDVPRQNLSQGDDVTYGTVYMGPSRDSQAIVYEVPSGQDSGRFHIAWDPRQRKYVAAFIDGIRVDWTGPANGHASPCNQQGP